MKYTFFTAEDMNKHSSGVNNFIKQVERVLLDDGDECEIIDYGFAKKQVPYIERIRVPYILRFMIFLIIFKLWGNLQIGDKIILNRSELFFVRFLYRRPYILFIHGSSRYSRMFWKRMSSKFNTAIEKLAIKFSNKTYILLEREEAGLPYYRKIYPAYFEKIDFCPTYSSLVSYKLSDLPQAIVKRVSEIEKLRLKYDFIVSFHGRIVKRPKNVDRILNIANNNSAKNIAFILFGSGPDFEEMKKLSEGCDNVILFGEVENNHLGNFLSLCDVGLILSDFEGICISGLDYIKLGKPLIATDVGDISNYIEGNGFLVNLIDTDEELLDKIRKCDAIDNIATPIKYTEAYFSQFILKEKNLW